MRCSNCGTELPPNTLYCPACGSQVNVYGGQQMPGQMNYNYGQQNNYGQPNYNYGQPMPPVQINTWLAPAILATIFCCVPFGIVSIVFAAKANSAAGVGNYQQAQLNANRAKIWFWVSFGCGLVGEIVYTIFYFTVLAASAAF